MAKKRSEQLSWWNVVRVTRSPAKPVGRVQAVDAANAIQKPIEQYDVPARFRERLLAWPVASEPVQRPSTAERQPKVRKR